MSAGTSDKIKREIEQHKANIEMGDALERLKSNRDFRTVILEGYLKSRAVVLVHAKASPRMQSPEDQASLNKAIDAIGALSQYFRTVRADADAAKASLDTAEQTLHEVQLEES